MFLLGLIPFWARILAVLALVAAVWGHGAWTGYHHEHGKTVAVQAAFELFKAETEQIGKAQAEQTAKVIANQKEITDATIQDYVRRLAALPRFGVQHPPSHPDGSPVAEISSATACLDGRPSDAVPAQALVAESDLTELANLAAQTTQQLVSLQAWIREQQAAWK